MSEYHTDTNNTNQDSLVTPQVLEMSKIHITGNVVPQHWYQRLTFDNGKPNFVAVTLLSDIVYWYRPVEVRDENTGKMIGWRKKFSKDFFQRQTKAYSSQFGFSERQVRDALKFLEDKGYIKRHFRDVPVGNEGGVLPNRQFIELIPESIDKLQKIHTYGSAGPGVVTSRTRGVVLQDQYTKTTPKTSPKTSSYSSSNQKPKNPRVPGKKDEEERLKILERCTPEQKEINKKLMRLSPKNPEDRMISPIMCARLAANNAPQAVNNAIIVYEQDCERYARKGAVIDSMEAYIVKAINDDRIPMSEESSDNREYFLKWSKGKQSHIFHLVDKYVVFDRDSGKEVPLNMKCKENFKKMLDEMYQWKLEQRS